MIKLFNGIEKVEYSQFIFPGGEVSVRIKDASKYFHPINTIEANLQSPTEIVELLMLTDAVKRIYPRSKVNLQMPYVPYARQDRVSVRGEALSIKVMADLINSQNYADVEIWDPHSDVTSALINNLTIVEQHEIAKNIVSIPNTILVAPDAGAAKKIYKLAAITGSEVVVASKVRDPVTGNITGTEIDLSKVSTKGTFVPSDARFLIVDDICDGGRTFTELAKVIRHKSSKPIDLYVTHGIFSKGLNVFNGLIDKIYCANPWFEDKRIIKI
jgi:ribose-phosphate pyrophosphokinase